MMATNGNIFQTLTAIKAGRTVRRSVSHPTGAGIAPACVSM
jgi:hypothetical protein